MRRRWASCLPLIFLQQKDLSPQMQIFVKNELLL
nr:MAG TPA: hypothetical protein [Herelleviridae sp.]